MQSALIALALRIGAPLVLDVLSGKIGKGNARLVGEVVTAIAQRLGVAPENVNELAINDPERVEEAMLDVEEEMPEKIALYAAELETRAALFEREDGEGWFSRSWRPAGMYLILFLWLWNIVCLHVFNAVWKIALPVVDLSLLLQFSALYMSLYMGGHTVKAVMGSRRAL